MPYHSPFTITSSQLSLVAEIAERVGFWGDGDFALSPRLRKVSDQVSDQVRHQVKSLLKVFARDRELSADELLGRLGLRHKPTFRKNYLLPSPVAGVIEMTQPDSPRSPTQKYRLTKTGKRTCHGIGLS